MGLNISPDGGTLLKGIPLWGNSLAVRLPKNILDALKMQVGDTLELHYTTRSVCFRGGFFAVIFSAQKLPPYIHMTYNELQRQNFVPTKFSPWERVVFPASFARHVKKQTAKTIAGAPKEEGQKPGAIQSITTKIAPSSAGSNTKPKPFSNWGKPVERNPDTSKGQIPKFGFDPSEVDYSKF